MKQGSGNSRVGDTKREPIAHAINPGGANQLGEMVAKNPTPLHAGRGFMAPKPAGECCHPSGSQGKHK